MNKIETIVAITGHRPGKLKGVNMRLLREKLANAIVNLEPTTMISGMALGSDMLWAELAIDYKIPLIAALPCYDQDKYWSAVDKYRYYQILENEQLVTTKYVSKCEYDNTCMQRRNEWMVMNSNILIACWNGSAGGTGNCMKAGMLRAEPYTIYQVHPETLKTKRLR